MEIIVNNFTLLDQGEIQVQFESAIGSGIGWWPYPKPGLGKTYYVAFDIPESLAWGINIIPSRTMHYRLRPIANSTILTGALLPDEGEQAHRRKTDIYRVRVGSEFLSLKIEGKPFPSQCFIDLMVNNLYLWRR